MSRPVLVVKINGSDESFFTDKPDNDRFERAQKAIEEHTGVGIEYLDLTENDGIRANNFHITWKHARI